jgi:hypothetical protein
VAKEYAKANGEFFVIGATAPVSIKESLEGVGRGLAEV